MDSLEVELLDEGLNKNKKKLNLLVYDDGPRYFSHVITSTRAVSL